MASACFLPPWSSAFEQVATGLDQIDTYEKFETGAASLRTIGERVLTLLARNTIAATGWSSVSLLALGSGVMTVEEDGLRLMQRFRVFAS